MVDVLTALREGLAPHYTVEREIGAGGMARVFLAAERHTPRKVAVKVMNPEVAGSEFRERFIREVELTSRLSHPHIVPILTSARAARRLIAAGYDERNVAVLLGGIRAWHQAGYPLQKW